MRCLVFFCAGFDLLPSPREHLFFTQAFESVGFPAEEFSLREPSDRQPQGGIFFSIPNHISLHTEQFNESPQPFPPHHYLVDFPPPFSVTNYKTH